MLMPKLAGVLAAVGFVCLVLSAFVGGTQAIADWVLNAAEAFLLLAAVVFVAYVVRGLAADIAQAS